MRRRSSIFCRTAAASLGREDIRARFHNDQGVKITKIGPGKVAFYSGSIGEKSEF
jgi:hypothetical protein